MKTKKLITVIVTILVLGGCANFPDSDRTMYRELKELKINTKAHKVKSPALAGVLNILPGFGYWYLAKGLRDPKMWVMFGVNFELWPLSIIWGIPAAIVDGGRINKRNAVNYYKNDPQGQEELEMLRAAAQTASSYEIS